MKVLVIAPHPDDEVLGVGGTIAKRVNEGHEVHVCIVTRGYPPMFNEDLIEAGVKECEIANGQILGTYSLFFLRQPAAKLDTVPIHQIINLIQSVIRDLEPDEVYIPHRGDIHIDHKIVIDAAMVALRPKHKHRVRRILAYEVPSETGWDLPNENNAFVPNVFEDITDTLELKIKAMNTYQSQSEKFPGARSPEAIRALAAYRGTTVCTGAAEAFSLIREIK